MTMSASAQDGARYRLIQRLLHWLIAVLVIGALSAGALLWAFGFEGLRERFGLAATNALYTSHKTTGVLILGLMVLRLALRVVHGAPPAPSTLSPRVATAAHATHLAFYGLLILMPVVGWAATAAGGFPVEFFSATLPPLIGKNEALSAILFRVHALLGLAIAAFVLLHVAAALRHWLVLKDGVMRRITLP